MSNVEALASLNSDDIEIDGCAVPLKNTRFVDPVVKSKDSDPHFDSGISSYLPSVNSDCEKLPVQCTEDSEVLEEVNVFEKLGQLSLEDEGIGSMQESSLDQPIEVDLSETDEDGDTIIHSAILSNRTILAIVLIELADSVTVLNKKNLLHQTALHLAVLTENFEVIQSLMKRNVDVTATDHQGNTPLHIACRLGDQDAVRVIVESFGNDVNARKKYFAIKNCEGLTCLHVATQHKEYMIMGHLFAKGADVNIGDAKSGRTVLHYAVERKDLETVALLLTHTDIDVDCKTFKGETPLVMAYWRNYRDILKRLKAKGAYFSYEIVEDSDEEDFSP